MSNTNLPQIITLLRLITRSQIANFWKKCLKFIIKFIIIRERPKNNFPLILRNLDNVESPRKQLGTKE